MAAYLFTDLVISLIKIMFNSWIQKQIIWASATKYKQLFVICYYGT